MSRLLVAPLSLLLMACAHGPHPGPISTTELRRSAPQFARRELTEPAELARLQSTLQQTGPVTLTVYFGDWCGDSVREVPRLLALTEALPTALLQLTLINLDTHKTDPAGLAKAAGVLRVPTMVVSRNGRELGRLVEKPATSIVGDLVELLSKPH